jgi:hypothetical protein
MRANSLTDTEIISWGYVRKGAPGQLPHVLRKLRPTRADLVECRLRSGLIGPIVLVQDLRNHGKVGERDAIPFSIMAIIQSIISPLDNGKSVTAAYQQMCSLFVDDDHVHLIAPLWLILVRQPLACRTGQILRGLFRSGRNQI